MPSPVQHGCPFADRILPIDQEIAAIWGEVTARRQQAGVHILAADGLIAATALRNGLHVMTRIRAISSPPARS